MTRPSNTAGKWLTFSLVLLVAVAFSEFLLRGPLDSASHSDFAAPYLAALRLLHGQDPYNPMHFVREWHQSGAGLAETVDESGTRPIYPPSTLPVLLLLTPLGWHGAVAAYLILCSLAYPGLILLLAAEVGDSWRSPARLAFIAFALALAPVHTGLHTANLSVAALLLAGYSIWFAAKQRETPAGLLLALSLCVKPTLAAGLLIAYLAMRRWKLLLVTSVFATCIAGGALIRLHFCAGDWLQSYRENLTYLFSASGVASYTGNREYRFDLLNLQLPFYELTHSTLAAGIFPWVIAGTLSAVWLWLAARHGFRWNWALIAAALLLAMMPIYQRNYNAGLVLFAALWAFRSFKRRIAKLVLLCCGSFLLPVEALLRRGEAWNDSLLWQAFLLPEASWMILVLTVLLLVAAAPTGAEGDPARPVAARS